MSKHSVKAPPVKRTVGEWRQLPGSVLTAQDRRELRDAAKRIDQATRISP